MKKSAHTTMSEALKAALSERGESLLSIEKKTGLQRASIARFVKGTQSIRLDLADRLAAYLGVTVNPAPRQRKGEKA